MEQALVAVVREAAKEITEEVAVRGAEEFAKQAAKHVLCKELAQEIIIIGQITTTGTMELLERGVIETIKTGTGTITKRVIIQVVGPGAAGAGGKKIAKEFIGKGASKVLKVSGVGLAVDVVFFVGFLTNDAVRYHNGGISGTELVANTAVNALGIPVGLVGAAIGQDLIPIPVVGGLVGGVLGAVTWNLLVHTVKTALT